ncbi:B- and T-lymphocyte attenuator [Engraulis encrasicolus]|uniref:B- and T-lymphocyte attenuator n=1 Tax=Engraulis encrasicolus TaxID=184585 RepID=UPI002FD1BC2D
MANRPPLLWLLLVMCQFTGAAVQDESMCDAQILVRRNTVMQASPTKPLMLNCPVKYSGCITPPTVTWCKLLTDGSCVNINMSDSMGIGREKVVEGKITIHLIFLHVTKDDDGLYRCEISGSEEIVSHAINVSVTGMAVQPTERPSAGDGSTGLHQNWLLYLVVSAVCLLVILTVILICVCTLRAGYDLKGRCLCIDSLRCHSSSSYIV